MMPLRVKHFGDLAHTNLPPKLLALAIPLASTPTEYPRNPFGMIGRP
jgi:hypothetical protein